MFLTSTGQSQHLDAFQAGREAALAAYAQAIGQLGVAQADKPGLVLVFGDVAYEQQPLLDGITSVLGFDVPMIGCSSSAQVTELGALTRAVVVMPIWGGSSLSCFPIKASQLQHDCIGAGRNLGQQALAGLPAALAPIMSVVKTRGRFVTIRPYSLLFFAGGQACVASALVDGIASVVGPAVQVVGSVGSMTLADQFPGQSTGTVYHNGVAYTDTVVGVVLASRTPLAAGLAHAFSTAMPPDACDPSRGQCGLRTQRPACS